MPPARPVFWLRPPQRLPACAVAISSGSLGPLQQHACPGFAPGSRSPSGLSFVLYCNRPAPGCRWDSTGIDWETQVACRGLMHLASRGADWLHRRQSGRRPGRPAPSLFKRQPTWVQLCRRAHPPVISSTGRRGWVLNGSGMAIDQDDHFLVAGSSRRDDDLLHVAARAPAVIAGIVLSIGSGAGEESPTPFPALTDQRVYVIGVPDRYQGLADQIKRLERSSPQSYYVVVVKSTGRAQNATSRYARELFDDWRSQASRSGRSFDAERSVIIVTGLENKQVAVHPGDSAGSVRTQRQGGGGRVDPADIHSAGGGRKVSRGDLRASRRDQPMDRGAGQ